MTRLWYLLTLWYGGRILGCPLLVADRVLCFEREREDVKFRLWILRRFLLLLSKFNVGRQIQLS